MIGRRPTWPETLNIYEAYKKKRFVPYPSPLTFNLPGMTFISEEMARLILIYVYFCNWLQADPTTQKVDLKMKLDLTTLQLYHYRRIKLSLAVE